MISILMATYNGERFLEEQLESILSQTVQDFVLYIQDDGSTDKTFAIACEYADRYSGKIVAARNEQNSGGAKYNFMNMMTRHRGEYIMLCDQDDVWMPDKIERTLDKMREIESETADNTPILIHTDSFVTDETLHITHASLKQMLGTAEITDFKQIVLQNDVTGATAMYNRALAEWITEIPRDFVMHDWWLAMVCQCFGKTVFIPDSTVLYRQHGENSIGARAIRGLPHKLYKLAHMGDIRRDLFSFYRQAGEFHRIYGDRMEPEKKRLAQIYGSLPGYGKWKRLRILRKEGLIRKGFFRALSQYVFG